MPRLDLRKGTRCVIFDCQPDVAGGLLSEGPWSVMKGFSAGLGAIGAGCKGRGGGQ